MSSAGSNGGDRTSAALGVVSHAEIREQLDRILLSQCFRNSERLQRFLKFAIGSTLGGRTEQLKESVLGREIFDRGPRYDPRTDSIVRVESQRLRKKLAEYYKTEGSLDPVLITFHSGNYTPTFQYSRDKLSRFGSRTSADRTTDPQTVAVLPFANLSPEPDQQYFCDGITEDITHALSRIPGIKVIGRTSVVAVKDVAADIREIGVKLGAGMVVEGSVRKVGNLLKISVQMVDSEVGHIQWSRSFDSVMGEVFVIQEEIALAVAQMLHVKLTPRQSRKLTDGAPNMEAYILYLRGRQAWNRVSLEGCRTAIGYYDRAVSLFPGYASPHAGLADAYSYLALWSAMRPRVAFPIVKQAALEALRINPDLAHAQASLAMATLFHDWSLPESAAIAKKATELEPCYGFGQYTYGTCLLVSGQQQEALRCFETAVQLNPLSLRVNRALGWAFYLLRRYQDAENWLQAAIALSTDSIDARCLLARVYLQEDRAHDALNEALQCQEDPTNPLALGILGACLARVNRKDEAEHAIKKLLEMSAVGYVDPYSIGQIYLGLEDFSQALESVRRSLEERTPLAMFFGLDPMLDPLRSDPWFSKINTQIA